ncbi:MAG: zinc ribbon domain-containing protein [Verrucomicrobia bacterium]|jgi:TM2 domain-containing membrane protein YozV|nr:zinc ribbon domain-containing protein [Verrucomicrobiota bacterium]
MFCTECGNEILDKAAICVHCGVLTSNRPLGSDSAVVKKRSTYVLFGLFLGGFGIHNFYAGYNSRAVTQLLVVLLTGILIVPVFVVGIWVLYEVCTVKLDAQGTPFC